jgi:hypothetical protein
MNGMNTYGGVTVQLHALSTPALEYGELLASHHSRWTLAESVPGIHFTVDWMGPRDGLQWNEPRFPGL